MSEPHPIPDSIQDALGDLLQEQFRFGLLAGRHGEKAATPRAADKVAKALVAVVETIRSALATKPAALTGEQLGAVLERFAGGCEWSDDDYGTAEALARAVERAHGIAAPGGSDGNV